MKAAVAKPRCVIARQSGFEAASTSVIPTATAIKALRASFT